MTEGAFSSWPDRKYCYWLESDNELSLKEAALHAEALFPDVWASHFEEIRLAACGVCGWRQDVKDPYNYFGCPECHVKDRRDQ